MTTIYINGENCIFGSSSNNVYGQKLSFQKKCKFIERNIYLQRKTYV